MNHSLYFICVCYQCVTTQRQTMQESLSVLYMCMLPVCNLTSTDNAGITVCSLYTYAISVWPHSDRQCRNHCLYFIYVCYQCVTSHPQTMQKSLSVLYICRLPVCNHTATDNAGITVCTVYNVCYQCVTSHPQTMQESLSVLYICMLPVCNHTATDNVWITICTLYMYAISV